MEFRSRRSIGELGARRIGLLPQNGEVHWDIDVTTLVSLGRFPHRGRWGESAAIQHAVERAMSATDVTQFATRSAMHLSGGERSRVLLARVLPANPNGCSRMSRSRALIRPTSSMCWIAFREVAASGAGVIVVLHDLSQAARVADDVVLMRAGRIVEQGARDGGDGGISVARDLRHRSSRGSR